ncbi:ATP-dependent nuclease [Flavobacterium phragmitis]|uniref:Putative ATP-dependent endonuclease of the OLD family n=1 Tax=Flavobacterium phragmitis TaxID=739143 RepID=A0A1I1QPL2_9FLAO|nr:AAA family ATPase [Flavobacterium phragmitis]SFD21223.1 putative ATP-dependent endonuclease of the OLD family [Flavobacterium phragmitis]
MGIRLKTIRIKGFRGFKNIEVDFQNTTVLVGTNNAGKTTLLKALQVVLTNSHFITNDDFFYYEDHIDDSIIIDLLFVPIDEENSIIDEFSEEWSDVFKAERIGILSTGEQILAFRTLIKEYNKTFKKQQFYIDEWEEFEDEDGNYWYDIEYDNEQNYYFEEIPFFYLEANRDILEDIKSKSSYLGRILSSLEFSESDKAKIETLISQLNSTTIQSSEVLTELQSTLEELDTAMDNPNNSVQLTPFTKKIRDLNKGIRINYSEFSMDYHGMGTRSWSSLLVLKSFLNLNSKIYDDNERPYFPILAIEEPESHLHPNAQKKIYSQINEIVGQKIISTHSNYIASNAKLEEIVSISKSLDFVSIGKLLPGFDPEEIRQICRQVINTRGEMYFSKLVVLFEGETEEQVLPLLIKKHFGIDFINLGINFIGVGGFTKYLPFIRFCESFNIEYLIFSDNEQNVNEDVLRQISKSQKNDSSKVVFVSPNNDFEKELCDQGYIDEVKSAYYKMELEKCANDRHRAAKQIELNKIPDSDYYEIITKMKTQFAPLIAEELLTSQKPLPPKIIELFDKISNILNL